MDLPSAVETYFQADSRADPDMLTLAFAANATVDDEGKRHHGHKAIRAWWLAAKSKYQHLAEPVDGNWEGRCLLVRTRVSGAFPNSPAMLDFAFTLESGSIASLRIG